MPTPLRTPRINNNDDTVRLSELMVKPGDEVRAGQAVAEIETDKANFTVEAERDCFILSILGTPGEVLEVGSILMWTGDTAGEAVPAEGSAEPASGPSGAASHSRPEPTLKAAILLAQYGIQSVDVPAASGTRVSVADVEAYVSRKGLKPVAANASKPTATALQPVAPGRAQRLSPEQRGMVRTVSWHNEEAVPGYLEITYAPDAWIELAAAYQKTHKMLVNPLLSLMAWWLAKIAAEEPQLNSTIAGDQSYLYDSVNLGFTVQSGSTLYLAVVPDAASLSARQFVDRLGELQRNAMKNSLKPNETTGSTIAFTSMARWKVSRHMPILPPHNSIIVAHSAPSATGAYLGATYDHRVLSGFDVVKTLQKLSTPPENL